MTKPFYSTKEVADLLGVDPKTVRRYLKEGRLKGTRIGRDYRILADSVTRLVTGVEVVPPVNKGMRVLATVNSKGGTGKSTTAHNLATGLSLLGRRVLLIDLDPQAHLTASVGLNPEKINNNIYHVLLSNVDLASVVKRTPRGLDIVPANIDLSGAEIDLVNTSLREFLLKDALEPVKEKYDYVIIDCPPSLGLLTLNALVAADQVIIPVQCEYLATRGLSLIQKTIRHTQHPRLNPGLTIAFIVPTMYDGRKSHHREVLGELHNQFPGIVFDPPIKLAVRVTEAPADGLSALEYDPSGEASMAYLKLAEEVDAHA